MRFAEGFVLLRRELSLAEGDGGEAFEVGFAGGIDEYLAALPADTRTAFVSAYAAGGDDKQELSMASMLYEISTRPYYVPEG